MISSATVAVERLETRREGKEFRYLGVNDDSVNPLQAVKSVALWWSIIAAESCRDSRKPRGSLSQGMQTSLTHIDVMTHRDGARHTCGELILFSERQARGLVLRERRDQA